MATTTGAIGILGASAEEALRPKRSRLQGIWRFVRQNPLGTLGLIIIVVLAFTAIFADQIAPYTVSEYKATEVRENPSWDHLFGTDGTGRDMFSRVVHGSRISMSVAFLSVIGGTLVATVFGIVSGYLGGVFDNISQRVDKERLELED